MTAYTTAAPTLSQLAVECVHFDDEGHAIQRRRVPLLDLMRGLTVTLPVQTTFRADRPGVV